MFLKTASFRHYKSLDSVDVEFSQHITVLVGPNAVGKSNLVDGLRFVRDAVHVNLEHAISLRGGIGRVRQWSRTRPYKVGIGLSFRQEVFDGSTADSTYSLSIVSQSQSNYCVDAEIGEWVEEPNVLGNPIKRQFRRDSTGAIETDDPLYLQTRLAIDQLALGTGLGLGGSIVGFVDGWRFSSLYPNLLREPRSPDRDTNLAEDGHNWASVIKALRRSPKGRSALERVFEAMRAVIPTFEEVTVTTVGSYLVPRFRFGSGAEKVEFDPVQLSDGTLRIFGILLALYQVPAPQLLLIEEPEQTVHPGVLGVLADAFREASETTQIIVTTHSPHFVDHFAPEEVRVVTMDGGVTHVSPIKKTQFDAVKRRLMSLQDFMMAEGLLPELP